MIFTSFELPNIRGWSALARQKHPLKMKGSGDPKFVPKIDLMEARRQLVAIRSRHAQNREVAKTINGLLGHLYVVREPRDRFHEARLINRIDRALTKIEHLILTARF